MYDPEELDAIRDAKESWESGTYGETVDRFGERKESFTTDTGAGGRPVVHPG